MSAGSGNGGSRTLHVEVLRQRRHEARERLYQAWLAAASSGGVAFLLLLWIAIDTGEWNELLPYTIPILGVVSLGHVLVRTESRIAAGILHLMRTQAHILRVLRRDHPETWERYGRPRPYLFGLSGMPSIFAWKAYRAPGSPELARPCATLRRSDVVLLPVLSLGGLYLLVA